MLSILATSVAGLVTSTLLDYIWLTKISTAFYVKHLGDHVTVKNGSLVPYLPALPLVYLVLLAAVWLFVIPQAHTPYQAGLYGAALGFLIYATYDLTNLATLKGYAWTLTIVDTLWGTFLLATVSIVMFLVQRALL